MKSAELLMWVWVSGETWGDTEQCVCCNNVTASGRIEIWKDIQRTVNTVIIQGKMLGAHGGKTWIICYMPFGMHWFLCPGHSSLPKKVMLKWILPIESHTSLCSYLWIVFWNLSSTCLDLSGKGHCRSSGIPNTFVFITVAICYMTNAFNSLWLKTKAIH
jgi:hypothetical protein